jgi:hypothetical protein
MKKTIALLFAVSILFLAGCCTTHEHANAKWEYQQVYDFQSVQKLAAEGWTLVGFHSFDNSYHGTYYILKRHVQ